VEIEKNDKGRKERGKKKERMMNGRRERKKIGELSEIRP
jgi:hypothetical protein